MLLFLSVSGDVDDEVEAHAILAAVETALIPFVELELNTNCKVSENIETPE